MRILTLLLAGLTGALLVSAAAHAIPDTAPVLSGTPEQGCSGPDTTTGKPPAAANGLVTAGTSCQDNRASSDPVNSRGDSRFCLDPFDVRQCVSIRYGRHIGSGSDILGELDGIRLDYRLGNGLRLQGIAGFPLVTAGSHIGAVGRVFGLSTTTRPGRAWDMNTFLLDQQSAGATDFQSVGGVLRHRRPGWSWLVYLDYDVAANSMGTATATSAWKLPADTTLSATIDHRSRAIPERQRGYLRQSLSTLDGWRLLLPSDRLSEYTSTGDVAVNTVAIGLSRALSRYFHLNSDVAMLESGRVTDTASPEPLPSRELIYHSRLSGRHLRFPGKLDIHYRMSPAGRMTSVALATGATRIHAWEIRPVLRWDYRSAMADSPASRVTSPVLKMEYRRQKQAGLQIEAGGLWASGVSPQSVDEHGAYFVSLAYEMTF